MKILVLSDVHIAKTTPWSNEWEDIEELIMNIRQLQITDKLPVLDGAILCGDMFNSPRVLPGDVVMFERLMDQLDLLDKPVGWITGNHDPGMFSIAQILKNAVNLNKDPLFDTVWGHSYSQNLDEVRAWLKTIPAEVTVTHQSASMFMNLGEMLGVDQLRPEDLHAPLNFIGDTHITGTAKVGEGSYAVSPGIPAPMRSRTELFESDPRLLIWEYNNRNVQDSKISTVKVHKRPYRVLRTQEDVEKLRADAPMYGEACVPVVLYIPGDVIKGLDLKHLTAINYKVIEFTEAADPNQVLNTSVDVVDSDVDNIDYLKVAASLVPDETPNKGAVLSLTSDLLNTEDPDLVVKNYLEGK